MSNIIDIREQLSNSWQTNKEMAEGIIERANQYLGQLSLERSGQLQFSFVEEQPDVAA
jgi:hypothetical protein